MGYAARYSIVFRTADMDNMTDGTSSISKMIKQLAEAMQAFVLHQTPTPQTNNDGYNRGPLIYSGQYSCQSDWLRAVRGHEIELKLAGAVDEQNDLYYDLWEAAGEAII